MSNRNIDRNNNIADTQKSDRTVRTIIAVLCIFIVAMGVIYYYYNYPAATTTTTTPTTTVTTTTTTPAASGTATTVNQ